MREERGMTEGIQLAIDTSTRIAGVAVSRQGELLVEVTWRAGVNHTRELVPALQRALAQAHVSLEEVDGLVVARGPGSFSGLRVGMSVAKGLAYALEVPLVGVSTLEVAAYQHAASPWVICPLHDAGRGEVAAALYRSGSRGWRRLMEEQVTSLTDLMDHLSGTSLFCGEVPPWARAALADRLGRKSRFADVASQVRRPAYLAALGWRRLAAQEYDDVATLQPLYLRRPPVEERAVSE